MGGVVAFIDAEHALDPTYAARIGVDIDEVLISQPDTGNSYTMKYRNNRIDISVTCSEIVPQETEGTETAAEAN